MTRTRRKNTFVLLYPGAMSWRKSGNSFVPWKSYMLTSHKLTDVDMLASAWDRKASQCTYLDRIERNNDKMTADMQHWCTSQFH